MRPLLIALPFAATLAMAACAQLPGGAGDDVPPPGAGAGARAGAGATVESERAAAVVGNSHVPVAGSGDAGASSDLGVDLRQPPRWRAPRDLVTPLPGLDTAESEPTASETGGIGELPEGDLMLRERVAERCASRPANVTEDSLLRNIVADLDADGVDPAMAVDALIIGRCGELADIVTEVVARGGEEAAMPVIERAVALTGPGSELIVERAAAEGLMLAGRARVMPQSAAPPPLDGSSGDYAMLYFPLGGETAEGSASLGLAELLGNAEPGYGMYTYIFGGGDDSADEERLAAYRELLRVIETYVLAEGARARGPDRSAHTFLVPVRAGQEGASLAERTGPELSSAMRGELAAYLNRGGQPELAARLASAPGPFLVSSLEPRLVPGSPQAVRLIVDLSGVGPEFMYSIVDAYDRDIPRNISGRAESLQAVRQRLLDVFPRNAIEGGAQPPAGDWVFLLGRRNTTQTDRHARVRVAAAESRR